MTMARGWTFVACLLLAMQMVWSSSVRSAEIQDCMDKHKVTNDDMMMFADGKEVTSDVKCFLKCALEHHEMLTEEGTFDWTHMPDRKDNEFATAAMECEKKIQKNPDLCDLAYQHSKCMVETVPKLFKELVTEKA